jgi:pyridoxine 5-phosphate synthase
VPEKRQELTTEGGLNVIEYGSSISDACARLTAVGVRVSLFIDADKNQIDAAKKTGAPVIEIHTGHYADASSPDEQSQLLEQIITAVAYAHGIGLQVNAGHGLNQDNIKPIAAIKQVRELNIGHAIIADAVFMGLESTVGTYQRLMREARE